MAGSEVKESVPVATIVTGAFDVGVGLAVMIETTDVCSMADTEMVSELGDATTAMLVEGVNNVGAGVLAVEEALRLNIVDPEKGTDVVAVAPDSEEVKPARTPAPPEVEDVEILN